MRISHFLAKSLNKLKLLPLFNLSATIDINKKKIIIPLIGGQGYANLNLSEPWMTNTLQCLRPLFNGNFIDVGVNLGQTLVKAHTVFDHVNYIGFEPNPSCVNYAQELIRLNGLENYTIFPIGVAAKTEVLKLNFFAADKSDSSATIIEHFKSSKEDHYIYVPVFDFHAISHFLPQQSSSILKIDVEGAELDVLLGLSDWIKAFHPLILVEILPVYSEENQSRLNRQIRIEELLQIWDYKIARIKKNSAISLQTIEKIGIHSVIEDCDYLLYPAHSAEKILKCFERSA